ncbi:1648_t:CDS:2 [Entrophospora sp. SA101]|nr:1648_t:CDS:2 [Entrophospora sp. SA101]
MSTASASTSTADTTLAETLEGISVKDPDYFTTNHDWSLLGFLLYRQQCSDFLPNKGKEHHRYS